jgi:hypothetical protein
MTYEEMDEIAYKIAEKMISQIVILVFDSCPKDTSQAIIIKIMCKTLEFILAAHIDKIVNKFDEKLKFLSLMYVRIENLLTIREFSRQNAKNLN